MFIKNSSRLLGLIFILSMHEAIAVLVEVDALALDDDRRVVLYSDMHVKAPEDQEQLSALLDSLQHCEETITPHHIFIEQPSVWFTKLFGCNSTTLSLLPTQIEQAHPALTLTTHENVEIRHLSGAADGVLDFSASFFFILHEQKIIRPTEKTVGTFTFQDIIDEFFQIKQALAEYYEHHDNKVLCKIYVKNIAEADNGFNRFLESMKKRNIAQDTSVLQYALGTHSAVEKETLGFIIIDAFCSLLDLHIIHQILSSTHENIIVVAGFYHIHEVRSALRDLNAHTLYRAGDAFKEKRIPLTAFEIQRGITIQKPSIIKAYASSMCTITLFVAVCYIVYIKIASSFTQTTLQG